MTVGVLPGTGIGVAMAGRFTPLMRPMRNSALAMVAPVLPAEIIALAMPSRTKSAETTRVESFLLRTELAGSSCMSMNSVATCSGKSPRSAKSAGPTSNTGMPAATACLAPSTISAGALSPPNASTATGNMCGPEGLSANVYSDATLVPTAVSTNGVWQLRVAATWANTACWCTKFPGACHVAAALHLRFLFLWYWHRVLGFRLKN